jgi:hypothetical protein
MAVKDICPCKNVLLCVDNLLRGTYVRPEQHPHAVIPYDFPVMYNKVSRSAIGFLPTECPRLKYARTSMLGFEVYRWT